MCEHPWPYTHLPILWLGLFDLKWWQPAAQPVEESGLNWHDFEEHTQLALRVGRVREFHHLSESEPNFSEVSIEFDRLVKFHCRYLHIVEVD